MAIKESKTSKLTTEEVTELNELRIRTSELTFQRGQLGIAEDNIKRQLNQLAESFNELYASETEISSKLFSKYGKGEVNLEEGTITTTEE